MEYVFSPLPYLHRVHTFTASKCYIITMQILGIYSIHLPNTEQVVDASMTGKV